MDKKGLFSLIFAATFLGVTAQEFVYIPKPQRLPIFQSKSDSLRYHEIDRVLVSHFRNRDFSINLDSLMLLRRQLFDAKVTGFRNEYVPHPKFTPWEEARSLPADSVKAVSFRGPEWTGLPAELTGFKQVVAVELIGTKLNKLPKLLKQLPNLRFVYLLDNQHPGKLRLSRNAAIERLAVRTSDPSKLPRSYRKLGQLKVLDLGECSLTSIPRGFRGNKKLKELLLARNEIDLASGHFSTSKKIEKLDLQNNKITVVPARMARFRNLKKLLFNNNRITEVSPTMGDLTALEELSFYNNKLSAFPSFIYGLTELRQVDLYYNAIDRVEPALGNLKALEVLYLSHNKLLSVPETIGSLQNLEQLYLHNNRLTEVPASLGQLSKLKTLRLSNNNLSELPESFAQLTKLQYFDISNNQFRSIPLDFTAFSEMEILSLVNNPIEKQSLARLTQQLEQLKSRDVIVHLESF